MKNGHRTLYPVMVSWTENTLNYKTMAAKKPIAIGHSATSVTNAWEEYDVAENIRSAVINPNKNFGFYIEYDNKKPRYEGRIASSEYSNISLRPKLRIIYTTEKFIELQYPTGGEKWRQGYTYDISWIDNIDEDVKIELLKNGNSFLVIAASIGSDGKYSWNIPADITPGDQYEIKISSVTNSTINSITTNISISEVFIVTSFPYIQDFDKFTNGTTLTESWAQDEDDYFDWTVHSGATPGHNANWPKTGPESDHTTGNGKYLYTEATGNSPNKRADLLSPVFDLRNVNDPKLSFWYHMYSQDDYDGRMGKFYVDLEVDGVWKNSVFSSSGFRDDKWRNTTINLSEYKGMVKVRFRGITGKTDAGDRAIDDFEILGNAVSIIKNGKEKLSCSVTKIGNTLNFSIPKEFSSEDIFVSLFNMRGKLIFKIKKSSLSSSNFSIPLTSNQNSLSSGIYLCRVNSKSINKVIRFNNY